MWNENEKIEFTDSFTIVPNAIWNFPELTSKDRDIYHALLGHRNWMTGLCYPSQSRIGRMTSYHRTKVNRRISVMTKLGLIQKVSTATSSQYRFPHYEAVALKLQGCSSGVTAGVAHRQHKQNEANKMNEQLERSVLDHAYPMQIDGESNCETCSYPVPVCVCHHY